MTERDHALLVEQMADAGRMAAEVCWHEVYDSQAISRAGFRPRRAHKIHGRTLKIFPSCARSAYRGSGGRSTVRTPRGVLVGRPLHSDRGLLRHVSGLFHQPRGLAPCPSIRTTEGHSITRARYATRQSVNPVMNLPTRVGEMFDGCRGAGRQRDFTMPGLIYWQSVTTS